MEEIFQPLDVIALFETQGESMLGSGQTQKILGVASENDRLVSWVGEEQCIFLYIYMYIIYITGATNLRDSYFVENVPTFSDFSEKISTKNPFKK